MANFMSAQTEIDGVVEKLEACNNKAANIIAELCVSKANDNSLKDNTTCLYLCLRTIRCP